MKERSIPGCLELLTRTIRLELIHPGQAYSALQKWLVEPNLSMGQVFIELGYFQSPSDLESLAQDAPQQSLLTSTGSLESLGIPSLDAIANSGRLRIDQHVSDLDDATFESFLASKPSIATRFIKEQHIGSGGTSDVYKAYDCELERHVALKVFESSN